MGWAFPDGSAVKNLPAVQETWENAGSIPGWEDSPEKKMVTCSSILAEKSYGRKELGVYSRQGRKESAIAEHSTCGVYPTTLIIMANLERFLKSGETNKLNSNNIGEERSELLTSAFKSSAAYSKFKGNL